jgi:hypothetical protein
MDINFFPYMRIKYIFTISHCFVGFHLFSVRGNAALLASLLVTLCSLQHFTKQYNNNPWRYSSDEPWPADRQPLAVFPDCTRRHWVDMWSAHRIPQPHFQLSKLDRYFFIQVTTQFIRSRG